MIRGKTALLAAGTLSCALGTGYVMQYGATLPGAKAPAQPPVVVTDIEDTAARSDEPTLPAQSAPRNFAEIAAPAFRDLPNDPLPAPNLPDLPNILTALDVPDPVLEPATNAAPDQTPDCDVRLDATPIAGAMVRLAVTAPCHPEARVSLHHNGLMVSAATDETGVLSIDMPALSESALFIASLPGEAGAIARADVSSVPFYDRIVLQWQNDTGLELHAREWGADYFSDGHVWHDSPGSLKDAVRGEGGFLTRLGDPDLADPRLAEVYSYPAGTSARTGAIAVSVEAEVTSANCGADISAQTLEARSDAPLAVRELTLAMPDCDAVGEYLVLKNLIPDLKIAAN
ncbi:hypothetical protein ROJ8625_00792 [Roseivivax jejudonensis]|uniref:Translocase n=1 Tax=Roseivivax jejudonensis TaxID=1529041 RepID=A0A1X6YH55_9RHOB|nr:hypothetical protein [Roseivivax jejudonensis]SLN21302.1 hypothetical protein ROJ8625_00792 [Roseivivax jejudonensis]